MGNHGIKAYILQWIEEHKQEIHELSDFMWENPELGLEEYEASKRMTEILRKYDFSVKTGVGGLPTAFVAEYGEGRPVIGINVEYDCLPGLSQKKDSCKIDPVIKGAPGQGCGHNILGPAALMAGLALSAGMKQFGMKGTIKLFGSPYEEASVGKPVVGKTGSYKDVDCFFDWHPWSDNMADYDICNSVFIVQYSFEGKTCHGASPWEGRSALDAGMLFGHAIEILREHLIPNGPAAAHTINYTFTDTGPSFANVVPNTTSIMLYGRFNDLGVAQDAYKRISKCAKGAAMATETTVSERLITFTHPKLPNKTLSKVVYDNLVEIGTPKYSKEEQEFVKQIQKNAGLPSVGLPSGIKPFGFSETIITDASEFSWNAPYASFHLAMAPSGSWHNWMVTALAGGSVGKKCLDQAAMIIAGSAVDVINDKDILNKAQQEWKTVMNGRTYESLIPDGHEPPIGENREIMERYFPLRKQKGGE